MTPSGHGTAIVGAGLMGRWHADAIARTGGAVSLIVDPNEGALHALGKKYPGARLDDALDVATVAKVAKVAHVCTPLATHLRVLTDLIEAGLHVLVEKPFTENASQARAIVDLAAKRGVLACPVHQFLFQDGVRDVHSWLPELGPVRRLEFSTCSAGAVGGDAATQDALIAEILPHPLSLVNKLLDVKTSDLSWQCVHPVAGEFRAMASVNETILDVAISAHGRPTENVLRVIGDNGSAVADLFHGFASRLSPNVSRSAKMAKPFTTSAGTFAAAAVNLARRAARGESAYPGLRELVREFHNAARLGAPSPIGVEAIVDVSIARDSLLSRLNRT
jgi:predicted dehydrogenase